jgi:hypothetical protein
MTVNASALDGVGRDLFQDPRFGAIRPDDLRAEVQSAGLTLEGVYGLEGPGWFLPDLAERWADLRRREDLLRLARQFEAQPSVLGVSAHLLAVARKPKVATGARA